MKTRSKKSTQAPRVKLVAIIVGLILLIPLLGNIFAQGWRWGILDFITMGGLLFITGLGIDLASRKITNPLYRIVACLAIIATLVTIWAELAVDGASQLLSFLF